MHAAIDPVLRDNSASWVNLVMQVGRVAANLCADNGPSSASAEQIND